MKNEKLRVLCKLCHLNNNKTNNEKILKRIRYSYESISRLFIKQAIFKFNRMWLTVGHHYFCDKCAAEIKKGA